MSVDAQKSRRRRPDPSSEPVITGKVIYFLSEQGRRDSLRQGGNGRMRQEVHVVLSDEDLELFAIAEDGTAILDLTKPYQQDISFDVNDPTNPFLLSPKNARWTTTAKDDKVFIEWDTVPAWPDLAAVARSEIAHIGDMEAGAAEAEAYIAKKSQEFLDNPKARANRIDRDYVVLGIQRFENNTQVAIEARKRLLADQEEVKKANRATLAEWIQRSGTDNQRQRLGAGLLPWTEAYEAVEDSFFAPLVDFPLYSKFEPRAVCHCGFEIGHCDVVFQSVDATELTAEEWEQFARIKATAPNGQFQFREHRAKCASAAEWEIRRGVIVKFALNALTFKREYALGEESQDVPF
jgi:hypothetical protein